MKQPVMIFLALSLAACQTRPASIAGEHTDLIYGVYEAFAKGDVATFTAAMAPDIEWNEAESFLYADGNPYIGSEAIVDGVLARLGRDWSYWKVKPAEFIESGNRVVVLGRYQARHKKTGAEVDAEFAHVFEIADGEIVSFHQYTDTAQLAAAAAKRGKTAMEAAKPEPKVAAKTKKAEAPAKKKGKNGKAQKS